MASVARVSGVVGKTKGVSIETTGSATISSSDSQGIPPRSHKSMVASAVTLHNVLDDEVLLSAFHTFTQRYHAEETLMFWMSVEVFKYRNWKAAKFFGVEANVTGGGNGGTTPTNAERRPSKGSVPLNRKSSKNDVVSKADRAEENAQRALALQRKIDQAAANRLGVTLEQLYLIKEADFIFDTFIQRGAENWCCLDFKLTSEIERRLDNPAKLTRECFREAQASAFKGMQEDLLPRFIRELMEGSIGANAGEVKVLQDHVLELTKSPSRRKTGASTMLAFAFGSLGSSSRRMSDSSKNNAASPGGGATSPTNGSSGGGQEHALKREASILLRSMSSMHILSDDGGSVGALGLSRSRLSGRRSALGMGAGGYGGGGIGSGDVDPFAEKPVSPRPLVGSPLAVTVRTLHSPSPASSPRAPVVTDGKEKPSAGRVFSVASVASAAAFDRPSSLPGAIGAVRLSNRSVPEARQRSLSDSALSTRGKRNRVVTLGGARGGGGFGPKVSSLAESAQDVVTLVLQGKAEDRRSMKRGNSMVAR